ncbi:uncharacterized protein LOC123297482 [Chrysoperla carnea]|uniref:uncharacterized protein LOC123297482 n=1 Tax=Chrysoperla carnea TaxID=189513 RepID=UPI001D06D80B|nr:uncharacterized protein LOC123297482 [Chrysoperla carnea]
MNSFKLFKILVAYISIVAVANGNLVTLDGQCPPAKLNPSNSIIPVIPKAIFTQLAETAPESGMNRTDAVTIWLQRPEEIEIRNVVRSKETGDCVVYSAFMKGPDPMTGEFDALYQVAPDTGFVGYKVQFLWFDPSSLTGIALACHNLSDSQYQAEIFVLSATQTEYNEVMQEIVKEVLEENNIEVLNQYMVKIDHENKCF